MKFTVTQRYKSDAGQFEAGDIIEMSAADAAWFNRDVAGLLVPYEPAERAPDAPPNDRMMKGAPKKRGKGA